MIKIKADTYNLICRSMDEVLNILNKIGETGSATNEDVERVLFDLITANTLLKLEKMQLMMHSETVETDESKMIMELAN